MTRTPIIGTIWLVSILAAFAGGWLFSGVSLATKQAGQITPPQLAGQGPVASAPLANDTADLRTENGLLKEKLTKLEGERDKLSRDFLKLTMREVFDAAQPGKISPGKLRSNWSVAAEKVMAGRGNGMFGGVEEMINLAIEVASYGKAGIQFMDEVINDHARSAEERQMALQILARLRDKTAFEALLKFRDDTLTELDYPYDLICYQLSSLPTAEIAPQIPGIVRQIDSEMAVDNFSPERAEVLYYLATVHNNPEARRLLNDPRIWDENLDGAIGIAQSAHDQAAHDFLGSVEQNHANPKTRDRATAILNAW